MTTKTFLVHTVTHTRRPTHTHTHKSAQTQNHWAPETKALSCSGGVLSLIHTALGVADSRHETHTQFIDVCEREIQHTHSAWICGYILTHTPRHGQRQWCCMASWRGVKAKQSYWRQVGQRRWLTKPNHTRECCLGHLTIRHLAVCDCMCLLTCSFACLCVCELWKRALIIGAYHFEQGRRRGARPELGASDQSWS